MRKFMVSGMEVELSEGIITIHDTGGEEISINLTPIDLLFIIDNYQIHYPIKLPVYIDPVKGIKSP